MKKTTTPGRRKLMRLIQEESGAGINSGDTVSTSSGHKTFFIFYFTCHSINTRNNTTKIDVKIKDS
jgi:hypothetical protein